MALLAQLIQLQDALNPKSKAKKKQMMSLCKCDVAKLYQSVHWQMFQKRQIEQCIKSSTTIFGG